MKVSESREASASSETFILERSVTDLAKMKVSKAGEASASSETCILEKSVADLPNCNDLWQICGSCHVFVLK